MALISEKERRDRDCKNMQSELNRMNTIIHVTFYYFIPFIDIQKWLRW
jgi:hypothetical protein